MRSSKLYFQLNYDADALSFDQTERERDGNQTYLFRLSRFFFYNFGAEYM